MGKIAAISISEHKGTRKTNVDSATLLPQHGVSGDAHAGNWHKQVSFLAQESIDKMTTKGLKVKSGDFAENITTSGVDLLLLPIGTEIAIGEAKLIISQIGKVCHNKCAIYHQAGDCVMPKEGIFGIVTRAGDIKVGDEIIIAPKQGISIGIITMSDRAANGVYEDRTGPEIETLLKQKLDCSFIRKEIMPDEQQKLERALVDFADNQKLDLVITNGSTGVSPRDIAPEAILSVINRRLPGFEEAMRMESLKKTIMAVISRAVCGIRGETMIISVPGSPKAAVENLSVIVGAIQHTIDKIHGDNSECGKA